MEPVKFTPQKFVERESVNLGGGFISFEEPMTYEDAIEVLKVHLEYLRDGRSPFHNLIHALQTVVEKKGTTDLEFLEFAERQELE